VELQRLAIRRFRPVQIPALLIERTEVEMRLRPVAVVRLDGDVLLERARECCASLGRKVVLGHRSQCARGLDAHRPHRVFNHARQVANTRGCIGRRQHLDRRAAYQLVVVVQRLRCRFDDTGPRIVG
jgi:hypothetical protein